MHKNNTGNFQVIPGQYLLHFHYDKHWYYHFIVVGVVVVTIYYTSGLYKFTSACACDILNSNFISFPRCLFNCFLFMCLSLYLSTFHF